MSDAVLYVTEPANASFSRRAFWFVLVVESITVAVLALFDLLLAMVIGIGGALTLVTLWAVIPRRYEVGQTELRVVTGAFTHRVPYETITEVRPGKWYQTLGYAGVRYATSGSTTVEVRRSRGMNLVISPADRDAFLRELRRAMDSA